MSSNRIVITFKDLQYTRMGGRPKDAVVHVVRNDPIKCAHALAKNHNVFRPLVIMDTDVADTDETSIPEAIYKPVFKYKKRELSVITCPTVSAKVIETPRGHVIYENKAMKQQAESKIRLMLGAAVKYGHKCVIIGPWGQQNKNPPFSLIQIYNKVLPEYDIKHIFFSDLGGWDEIFYKFIKQL